MMIDSQPSRGYKLSTPSENTCKCYIVILYLGIMPQGTASEEKEVTINRIINDWMSGKEVKDIPEIAPN